MVLMVGAADHITGLAGLTLTITASKDGAAFAGIAPSVTDRSNGWYAVALTAAHTDTLGDLALHITGAAADPVDMVLLVEGGTTDVDVSSRLATAGYTAPDNAGIAAIPDAATNAAAVFAQAAVTPMPSDVQKVNSTTITGTGVPPTFDADGVMTDPGDPWVAA
jgi:hypothetical protein